MKRKILITGGLGYIGFELCKSLTKNPENELIAIDSNFNPFLVSSIIKWGVKFYQRDLFNIRDLLIDADIVIHTAGVTQVPQTKAQSSKAKDDEIIKVGVDGTKEIINFSKEGVKIIFLSTHVIFEGSTDPNLIVTENSIPCPVLAYAMSKYQSELDLIKSGKDYVILRLSSVTGYNDAIRWKIVGNLFAKMTAIDNKIKIFGKDCFKPLVCISDVARAITFSFYQSREVFNVVS
jgi:UDP-glucose 4-epimerase